MPSWLRVLTRRLDGLDDRMNKTSTVHSAFRQATLNCGGAGDPAVLEAVTVLICALDPDVVCLQELWDADPRVQVALAPFVFVASSEAGRGRGMWVLVHRRLHRGGGKMRSPGLEKNAEKCGKNAENARKNAA